MTAYKGTLTCDGQCGEELDTNFNGNRRARYWAHEREGWVITASGLDLCPACELEWRADR